MDTTIQISRDLLEKLKQMKIHSKESYESLLWDLIEDRMELSEETKREIGEAREQYKRGETISHKEVKKRLGL